LADWVPANSNSTEQLTLLAPADPRPTLGTPSATQLATDAAVTAASALQGAAWDATQAYLKPADVRHILTISGEPITDIKSDVTTPRIDLSRSLALVSGGADDAAASGQTITGASQPGVEPQAAQATSSDGSTATASETEGDLANAHGDIAAQVACPFDQDVELAGQYATGSHLYQACRTLAAGPFSVASTADVTVEAGQRITLRPGFSVEAGGRFNARVTTQFSATFDADLTIDGFEGTTIYREITVIHDFEEEPSWTYVSRPV
jgi:hypothetical protein